MHDYYDEEDKYDREGLEDCCSIIYNYCKKWARLGGQIKTKYGGLRFYAMFGLSFHSLIYPGHYFTRFPKWLSNLDFHYITPILNKLFGEFWSKWQAKVYSDAYWKALNKYPHLRKEILCDADQLELIKGVTRKEETDEETLLHVLGWNGEILTTWRQFK